MDRGKEDREVCNLVQKEYKGVYHNEHGNPVNGLTHYETRLTCVFTVIYGVFGVVIIISLIA